MKKRSKEKQVRKQEAKKARKRARKKRRKRKKNAQIKTFGTHSHHKHHSLLKRMKHKRDPPLPLPPPAPAPAPAPPNPTPTCTTHVPLPPPLISPSLNQAPVEKREQLLWRESAKGKHTHALACVPTPAHARTGTSASNSLLVSRTHVNVRCLRKKRRHQSLQNQEKKPKM